MVRTKADGGARKAVAAKAPRKVLGSSSSGASCSESPSGKQGKYAGGNSVCPRPTPEWQKGIGTFFTSPSKPRKEKENEEPMEEGEGSSSQDCPSQSSSSCAEDSAAGSSSPQKEAPPKNNLIESDDDE